ncbi:MAG: TonB-dependent receptor plug domain-containing protein [Balneolaceae bacterium]
MKTLLLFPFLLLFVVMSCSSTETTTNQSSSGTQLEQVEMPPKGSVSDDKDFYRDLSDYLRRIPGVNVTQNTVTIRGISSFTSGIEPLFVIDGQVVGTSYAQVKNMISVRQIDYVQALKGSDAATYGVRGGNGVILIVTKK